MAQRFGRLVTAFQILVGAAFVSVAVSDANAVVEYAFSGTVTPVDDPLTVEFQVGDSLTVEFSVTPGPGSPGIMYYLAANFVANIGSYPVSSTGAIGSTGGSFAILNDFGGSIDQVHFEATDQGDGLLAAGVAGYEAKSFDLILNYPSVSDLTSLNLLPQFVFDSPRDMSAMTFFNPSKNMPVYVAFTLTSFAVVPEPPSPSPRSAALHCWLGLKGHKLAPRGRRIDLAHSSIHFVHQRSTQLTSVN